MPREHDDLINAAQAAPDIETALEGTFRGLAARWKDVATRNDYGKGAAMSAHMTEDVDALVTAIMNHPKVFKGEPVKPPPSRASTLTGVPKEAVRPENRQPGESLEDYNRRLNRDPQKLGEPDADYLRRTIRTPQPNLPETAESVEA